MSKAKKDINQNFEMLKAQMQAKRQKAEKQSDQKVETNNEINTEVIDIKDNAKDKEIEILDKVQISAVEKEIPIIDESIDISSKALKTEEKEKVKEESPVEEIASLSEEEEIEEEEEVIEKKPVKKKKPTKKKRVVEVIEEDDDYLDDEDDIELDFFEDDDVITTNKEGSIKIKIKKREKPEAPRRATYYLKQETIRKIEKVSKMSGIGKSKLVQLLLDQALDNLEIEK
ncbi:MAG: hypothetical protein ACRC28_17415 [Clostridium sp.]|uniref:hypothetical protein n=1 Tax=Clostridium sp. TaxID=1506 RepID=UPI003F3555DD